MYLLHVVKLLLRLWRDHSNNVHNRRFHYGLGVLALDIYLTVRVIMKESGRVSRLYPLNPIQGHMQLNANSTQEGPQLGFEPETFLL